MVYDSIKGKKYENVYCNIDLLIEGYTRITGDDIGKYRLHDGIIFIDEAAIEYDSRDFKNFRKELVRFFMMHGHFRLDIVMFSQFPDSVDKKIRAITTDCYMVYRPVFTGRWFSKYYRIPYGIVIPDSGDQLGEIVQGYKKPPLLARIFAHRVYRPKWYKYFDSWEEYFLPALPKNRLMTATKLMRIKAQKDSGNHIPLLVDAPQAPKGTAYPIEADKQYQAAVTK
jgi:hypothetical protein